MSDKTLGQVAYEAWLPAWLHPVVKWEEIPEAHRHQWKAAAEAVSTRIAVAFTERWEAERAVIEAARELLRISRHYRLDSTEGKVAAAKVIQVTGALEAAEKGE